MRIAFLASFLSLVLIASGSGQAWFDIASIVLPEDVESTGNFAAHLVVDGDLLIVADPEREGETRDYGAVSVYHRVGSDWELSTTLVPEGLGFAPEFGLSLAIDGDTLAVGSDASFTISEGFSGSGQVFVYQREGDDWGGPVAVHPNDQSRGSYGAEVALVGDTMAVGAPTRNSGGGEVVIYTRNGDTWTEVTILQDPEPRMFNDGFGEALLFIDESTLVVGSPGKDNRNGAAIIFTLQGGTWEHATTLKPDTSNGLSYFGASLAHFESTLLVGSPTRDNSGVVFVYEGSGDTWDLVDELTPSNGEERDDFGRSLAISESTILVSAPEEDSVGFFINRNYDDNTLNGAGAVYQFTRNEGVWEESAFLKSPSGDNIGASLALDGDAVIAGGTNEFIVFQPGTPRSFIELELAAYAPDLDSPIAGPGSFGFNEPWPIRILNSLFSRTTDTMRLEFTADGSFMEADCVCVVIRDTEGNLPNILNVTIDPASTLAGFDMSRLSFDENSITVNGQGLVFAVGDVLQLNLELEGGTMPETTVITHYEKDLDEHRIHFESTSGRTDWRVFGGADLQSFPNDHTEATQITEPEAGRYELILHLPTIDEPKYFFRIE